MLQTEAFVWVLHSDLIASLFYRFFANLVLKRFLSKQPRFHIKNIVVSQLNTNSNSVDNEKTWYNTNRIGLRKQ